MAHTSSSNANAFTNSFFNSGFMKGLMTDHPMLPVDMGMIMESQRKNMEAFTEAQQLAMNHLQSIAQRQSDIMSQMVADQTEIVRQILDDGTPEEKMSRQADAVRKSYERSVNNLTEMTEMMTQSSRETGEIINQRITATLVEFQSGLEKSKKPSEKERNTTKNAA